MTEKRIPKEIWDLILAKLQLQDQLIFLFTVIGHEKKMRMDTSAAYFLDHNQKYRALSIPEIRQIMIPRIEDTIYSKPQAMQNFYSPCCNDEDYLGTITYGTNKFTLRLEQASNRGEYKVDNLVNFALLDEAGTSFSEAKSVKGHDRVTIKAKCKACKKRYEQFDEEPLCRVCNASVYPCLPCNCEAWYCNKHVSTGDFLYGWCSCGYLVCRDCGYYCHGCSIVLCRSCGYSKDCKWNGRRCYACYANCSVCCE